MMQGYIVYWEGYDSNGTAVRGGNWGVNVEFEEYVMADEFLLGAMETLLTDAQLASPRVEYILIKGVFKL